MTILQALVFGPPPPPATSGFTSVLVSALATPTFSGGSRRSAALSATAVQTMAMDATDAAGLVNPLANLNLSDNAPFGTALVQVKIYNDGSIGYVTNFSGSNSHVSDWYLPNTPSIGSSFYLRTSKVASWNANLVHLETEDAWLGPMTGAFELITVNVTVSGSYSGQLLVEISDSSSGPADTTGTYTFNLSLA